MRTVILFAILAFTTGVLGQERAFWKFYSGYDCDSASQIGFDLEPVGNPETRSSIPCTNVAGQDQSFEMHVGIVTSVPDKVDWVHTQWNTDPSRCEASLGSWDFIAGKFGVCIKYVYSDGKSTSFIQASCNTNDFWNDPDQGEIISFFGPNHDCSGQNASYPFLEVPVEGHVACRETAAEADPYAIGGVCPENFWDLAPVAVPEAPTTVPTTTPSSTPIRIPVAGPSAKSAASVAQMGMVALGLIALAL